MTTLHRTINGEPYTLTPNKRGWQVTATSKRIDRMHRSYQVITAPDGRPTSCSCPQYHYTKLDCKHMREVLVLWFESLTPQEQGPSGEDLASVGW